MKNITVSVDDDTYRMARIRAAERATSVSALVRSYLLQIACGGTGETEFQRLEREERELRDELRAQRLGLSDAHNLSREELYSRHEIR
jgi:plasmid stability protein